MKHIKVNIPYISGIWQAPSSKSELIRRIAIAMRCKDQSTFSNVTWCNDSYAMLNIAENWGAHINISQGIMHIKGTPVPVLHEYQCDESALCLRLMLPILSMHNGTFLLLAQGTLLKRPIGEIEQILQQMGASIHNQQNYPPIKITGSIKPNKITIEYPISSQHISGLLMTLPLLPENSYIKLNRVVSLPYIQLTIQVLREAGIVIQTNETLTEYHIEGNQVIKPITTNIEGDWSAASLICAAAAIDGNIQLNNLSVNSLQADKEILHFLNHKKLHISTQKIHSFTADITHYPDLFPALLILAAHANNNSEIHGINRLIHKESNRLEAFVKEFSKFGIRFSIDGDILKIRPPIELVSCEIDPHYDHRIAMAAALMVIGTKATVTIHNAQCVNKSYPSFWEDLSCLGAKITEIE
ncbi:MAG: 3-phosphoshikimate 1-carboxyvinyltransferase [Bacteroidales bacterium]|nr:3-phosphoshikimate 1-carboxyvinyltransferase [Bacteroidales bacterium]